MQLLCLTGFSVVSVISEFLTWPDKIVLLGKTQLDAIEVLIFKFLFDSYFSHDEFVLVNNVLRKYNEMEEEIKTSEEHTI